MAKVTLLNISKTYSGAATPAVTDLTLEIADHELVVLTGPVDAGKTTVLRMIAGLEEVTRGEISIGERVVHELAPRDRDVALVVGSGALYPTMTVAENITFGLKLRKFAGADIEKRLRETAAILGLDQLLSRKPEELSVVERQRTAIARAIVRQPKVILFDEPLAELESADRASVRAEIARLQHRLETTMIFATRDPLDAMAIGGTAVVIENGVLQQTGAPSAIYDAPANLTVARFFGRPGMNLIRGTLKVERDALLFREAGDGTIEVRFASDPQDAQSFTGNEVVLGVRPEDMRPVPLTKSKEIAPGSFRALVDLVEIKGSEAIYHLDTGAHAIVCRAPREAAANDAGRRMQIEIEAARMHLFDAVSGARIV